MLIPRFGGGGVEVGAPVALVAHCGPSGSSLRPVYGGLVSESDLMKSGDGS